MSVFRFLIPAVILFILNNALFAQAYSIKGQFWASGLTHFDVPSNQSSLEANIGYIPTLSFIRELDNIRLLDIELSYQLDIMYSGDSLINNSGNFHRCWARYSNNKMEARLGLQKIVFGPSQVLRSLSWFDTIDLKDPTGQTNGVKAFRLRWFPSNEVSLWSWAIMNDEDTLSYGGRGELSTSFGEWGLTYHQDPSHSVQMIGKSNISVFGSHNRLAIDYRYDGVIGLWNESAMIKSDNLELDMITVGSDYTLPIGSGILIMTEAMQISRNNNNFSSSNTFIAFMTSVQVGMFHNIMLISTLDWDENNVYNYLRWSSTFDSFSINCMASINPNKMGNNLQFMFIYNH
jgi:hypothetical protein